MPVAQFLEAEDLDDLLDVAMQVGELSPADNQAVCTILASWSNRQAVANLLFHPRLIPSDLRIASLLRGLNDQNEPYYQLAATVGLHSVDPTAISHEESMVIRGRLFDIITSDSSVVSSRASVSIQPFLSKPDGAAACAFLDHPNETVRHNLLAWLVQNFELKDPDELTPLVESSTLPEETKENVLQTVTDYIAAEEEGSFTFVGDPLYSYIPNLRDYR